MECRAGTIYLSAFSGRMAGLYRFSFSLALLWRVRYGGNGGWWSGFLFISFFFAVGSPGVWLPVVGFSSFIN